jgi:hypothetical protein
MKKKFIFIFLLSTHFIYAYAESEINLICSIKIKETGTNLKDDFSVTDSYVKNNLVINLKDGKLKINYLRFSVNANFLISDNKYIAKNERKFENMKGGNITSEDYVEINRISGEILGYQTINDGEILTKTNIKGTCEKSSNKKF